MVKPVIVNGVLTPICPHCHVHGVLCRGSFGRRWECPQPGCDARVGVHRDSRRAAPLGTMARGDLRRLRIRAHGEFDPLWRDAAPLFVNRKAAYAWLARFLEIPFERCHFGEFDDAMCLRALAAIHDLKETPR